MDIVGVNLGYLLVTLFNLLLLIVWPVAAVLTLFGLRRRDLPDTALAIWAAVIVIIPILGALAFWIVQPGERKD
jgi:uncharacterized membrane protein